MIENFIKKNQLKIFLLLDILYLGILICFMFFKKEYNDPTYNYLVVMFPSLSYTIENAKHNLNRWQKLADEGRKKGWSPVKIKIDLTNNGKNKDKKKIAKKKEGLLKKKANVVEIKIEY